MERCSECDKIVVLVHNLSESNNQKNTKPILGHQNNNCPGSRPNKSCICSKIEKLWR